MSDFCRQRNPNCEAAKENEGWSDAFCRSLWIHRFLLAKEEHRFLLDVETESRLNK